MAIIRVLKEGQWLPIITEVEGGTPPDLSDYYTKAETNTALALKADDNAVVKTTKNQTIAGDKTFSGNTKLTGSENFGDVFAKRYLGAGSVGTTYANLTPTQQQTTHRFWKISFPTGAKFWGKIKISLYGGYSSYNASGKMAKEINVNFNGASMYSNVGCYTELSGYVENDFRISEAIWDSSTSQWEFWIYSHRLSGNNVPKIVIEAWATSTYLTPFNNITFTTIPQFLTDSTYNNVKGNSAGQTLTKTWADLPTFQDPYGNTIANMGDLDNKLDKNNAIPGATKAKITYDSKGLVTGGTNLIADDIPIITKAKISDFPTIATKAEAEAGTDNTKMMTPLRVKESILANATGGGGEVIFEGTSMRIGFVGNQATFNYLNCDYYVYGAEALTVIISTNEIADDSSIVIKMLTSNGFYSNETKEFGAVDFFSIGNSLNGDFFAYSATSGYLYNQLTDDDNCNCVIEITVSCPDYYLIKVLKV